MPPQHLPPRTEGPGNAPGLADFGDANNVNATSEGRDPADSFRKSSKNTATITINPSVAPFLIGARGATVRRMEEISGARIKVSADEGTVTIQGNSPAQVEGGRKAVMEQLAQSREHGGQSNGGRGRGGRDSTFERRKTWSADEASANVEVAAQLIALVIGTRGQTVKGIEAETGARVNVGRDGVVAIRGSAAAVAAAEDRVRRIAASKSGETGYR